MRDAITSSTNDQLSEMFLTVRYLATGKIQLTTSQSSDSCLILHINALVYRPHIIQQFIVPFGQSPISLQDQSEFHGDRGNVRWRDTHYNYCPIKRWGSFRQPWPASTHDSCIWMESGLRQLFERQHVSAGCHWSWDQLGFRLRFTFVSLWSIMTGGL